VHCGTDVTGCRRPASGYQGCPEPEFAAAVVLVGRPDALKNSRVTLAVECMTGNPHQRAMSGFLSGNTFARAVRIAGYNWPLYAAAAVGIVVGLFLASLPGLSPLVRWLGGAVAVVAGWFACASFCAFHAMFDRSELLGGKWLKEEFPQAPARWVQINVSLEETTLPLDEVFPATEGKSLDLYNPAVMTEPAISRARKQKVDVAVGFASQPESLPVENGWAGLVVVTLAAHEIRDGQKRERFFRELRRVVSRDGRVVVVEHLRDFSAALAFGPGIFHFFPRREWLRLGSLAGLEIERERRITPFVRVFIYRRPPPPN
jgi:SAM-dependent methyltransferase